MLCGVSGLAFAIGVYLPLASMAPLYVGGCVRALGERGRGGEQGRADRGVLAASGLVAGRGTGRRARGAASWPRAWRREQRTPRLTREPASRGAL